MKRQNPKLPEKKLEQALTNIKKYFQIDWLEKVTNKNPVAKVWNRKDWLATNELFTLGSCIESLKIEDERWLKTQVKQIKTGGINQINGAIFEILGIGYLAEKYNIEPTKPNQAGYDAIITSEDNPNKKTRLSIKNYRLSQHQQIFNNDAISFEKFLIASLECLQIKTCQVLLNFNTQVPEKNDWKVIKDLLQHILEAYKREDVSTYIPKDRSWQFIIGKLPEENYSDKKISYSLIISCVYHKNEKNNIISKLENACSNLVKHSNFEDENVKNALLIRLPITASFNKCREWVNDYFLANKSKPISTVILYQPSVVSDSSRNRNFIHHCTYVYQKDKLGHNNSKLSFPVGVTSNAPSTLEIIAEGLGKVISIDEKYIMQLGNHYLKAKKMPNGSTVGNVKMLSFGINSHLILEEPFSKPMQINGIFPPNDNLNII
jgi:hypothetical protein